MRTYGGRVTADAAIAAGFVLAAAAEALILHHGTPALLGLTLASAALLAVLVVRRTRPALPICVIAGVVIIGATVQRMGWPSAPDNGGVWMFALMFSAYSLGVHGHGRALLCGGVAPLLVGLAIDVPTMSGWALVNGVLFLTGFVGGLPTVVGAVVRARRRRLELLENQQEALTREQEAGHAAAILAERVRATHQLQGAVLDGLRSLADDAARGVTPGEVERSARRLLGTVRAEVAMLTAPVPAVQAVPPESPDHLRTLRANTQRWAVLGAGVLSAGLALEPARSPTETTLEVVAASVLVCLPLAFVWWRPLLAITLTWCAAVLFSRGVAPLDGTLSGTGLCLATAFAAGALLSWRAASIGLAVCLIGQVVGVGAADPLGEAVMMILCWCGGVAVSEASRLVEQGRNNTRLLAAQDAQARQHAVVAERVRLARELHDQLGHSLTVVALQAGAARRMASTDPSRSDQVMATVAGVIQDGLTAMAGDRAADLATLLQRTRAAGLAVSADVAILEHPETVGAPALSLAHRVVQEALTNVLRHAPGASATVVASLTGDVLTVDVTNTTPCGPGRLTGVGQGLGSLRERVGACGGSLAWGPLPDGGFAVRVELPARARDGVRQ